MTTTFKSLLSTLVIALVVLVAAPSADAASVEFSPVLPSSPSTMPGATT